MLVIFFLTRKLWRYHRCNQKPTTEKGQTTQ